MIFSANFYRCKVNLLIYVKFWWQACLPTLFYSSELFTLTPSLLEKLERCQLWFIREIFYVPKFTPKQLLLKLSGLDSIESEIAVKKMLFLGRLISGGKTAPVVQNLFESRTQSYFDTNIALKVFCQVFARYFINMTYLVTLNLCFLTPLFQLI